MAELRLSDTASAEVEAGVLVIPLVRTSEGTALADCHGLPRSAVSHLRGAIDTLALTGDVDEVTLVPGVPRVTAPLVALTGLGVRRSRTAMDPEQVRRGVGAALRRLAGKEHVAVCLPAQDLPALRAATEGAALGAYAVAAQLTRVQPTRAVQQVTLLGQGPFEGADRALRRAAVIGAAVSMCRDLVNDPLALLTPEHFVQVLRGETRGTRTSVTDLGHDALVAGGFGGLVGAGAGSAHGARLVTMSYRPRRTVTVRLSLVGRGTTSLASGQKCLQSSAGMASMTSDMAGAAAVAAAVLAIAELGLPLEVTAHLALAEHRPDAAAPRPGDVVVLRGGTTVEIVDPDAAGRLILADALASASESTPDAIVDLGTLAGAQLGALGPRMAAVLGNDEALAGAVIAAAERAGELAWRLPIPDDARASLRSTVADLRNTGPVHGGMLYAAGFLREFVGSGPSGAPIPWAHVDILGPALNRDEAYGYTPKGGTGYGVQTLVALAEDLAAR